MRIWDENANAIFAKALEIEAGEARRAYMDQACAGNEDLRARVAGLLKAHEEAGDFLETPAIEVEITSGGQPLAEGPGTVIGPYKLLERIGEGGFGMVYMAEQQEPIRRKVALKIIKLGMDTKQVVARFEAERQALAMMDHPNIAKVLDAGATDSGRPYFVMELVGGVPITEYCDKSNLPTRDRLELFIDVCRALQHAHQKGVIHRDVKPTNVLVAVHDGEPVPKVIDFGIAKALGRPLTEKTVFTEFRQFIGTPEYMSPEQAQLGALDIDTRCDIYALGVLLYELLTGATPFEPKQLREAGYDEILRIIRETDPPKPSTRVSTLGEAATQAAAHRQVEPDALGRLLRGDLDWIAMKALEKDRGRRYETANGLALDVQRHLSDEPVQAGPPGVRYRMRKFIRRHRAAVTAAALVAAALVIGLAFATVGFVEASRGRESARREAARATAAEQDATQRHRQAKRLLARSQLSRGVRLLNEGNGLGLLDLVEARITADEIPDLRDSAARLWAIAHALHADRLVHVVASARLLAFSPDGILLTNQRAELWDLATGRLRASPRPRLKSYPYTVVFSPDGKLVAAHSALGEARLFDTASGRPVGPVLRHECGSARPQTWKYFQLSAAFSPDGRLLATGWIDGTAQLWQTDTFKPQGPLLRHKAEVRTVAFSSDGKLLATGSEDATARLWDVATGQPHGPPLRHRDQVLKVAFSPEGKLLATMSAWRLAYLWETDTGRLRKRLQLAGTPADLAFSPDGKLLATCDAASMAAQLWDTTTGVLYGQPLRHTGRVDTVQFTPDGKTLVTGSADTAWVWDVATGQPRGHPLRHRGIVNAVVGPKGKFLGTAVVDSSPSSWKFARIWRTQSQLRAHVLPHRGGVRCLAFSPDSKYVATASRPAVRLWEVATGRPYGHLLAHSSDVTSLAFSRAANVLVTRSRNGTIRLWNPQTQKLLDRQFRDEGPADALALSPDGQILATVGSGGKEVRLWEVATGKAALAPLKIEKGAAWVRFCPDGKLRVKLSRGTGQLWDIAAPGGPVCRELRWLASDAKTFSPDGKHVAKIKGDGSVELVDVETGKAFARRLLHAKPVQALAYSPDGSMLATASGAGNADTVRLWHVRAGAPYHGLTLPHEVARGKAMFSPDGKILASRSDRTVRLWRLPVAPTDPRELRVRTWVALGARHDPNGVDEAIAPQQWRELRDELRAIQARRRAPAGADQPTGVRDEADRVDRYSRAYALQRSADKVRGDRPQEATEAYRQALALLERLAADYPNIPAYRYDVAAIHRSLAKSLQAVGKPQEAQEQFRKAAAVLDRLATDYPSIPYYRSWLGRAHTELGALLGAAGKPEQARDHRDKAVAAFSAAIELRSDNYSLWNLRGGVYFKLKEHEKAIADARKAIKLRPRDAVTWHNLGHYHEGLGGSLWGSGRPAQAREQYGKAVAAFSRAINLRPNEWNVRTCRGSTYCELGRWDAASADFAKAVELKPDQAVFSYLHAVTRLGAGDVEGYRSACAAMLKRFGQTKDPDAAHWAAWTCALAPKAVADPAEPVRLAEKAVSAAPGKAFHVCTLALALYRAARFTEALQRLNELTAAWDKAGKMPTQYSPAYTWFFLAMAHHRLGGAADARKWLDKAVKRAEEELQAEAGAAWHRRLTLKLLRREAEALLGTTTRPASQPATKEVTPGKKQ